MFIQLFFFNSLPSHGYLLKLAEQIQLYHLFCGDLLQAGPTHLVRICFVLIFVRDQVQWLSLRHLAHLYSIELAHDLIQGKAVHAEAPDDRDQVNLVGNVVFDLTHRSEESFVFLEAQAPLARQTSQYWVVVEVVGDGNARLFMVVLLLIPGVESVGYDGKDFVLGD